MSNNPKITNITINDTTYDIEDASATAEIANINGALEQTNIRVTALENTPIPESTVETAVNNYVESHSGGFATKAELEELDKSVINIDNKNIFNSSDFTKVARYSSQCGIDGETFWIVRHNTSTSNALVVYKRIEKTGKYRLRLDTLSDITNYDSVTFALITYDTAPTTYNASRLKKIEVELTSTNTVVIDTDENDNYLGIGVYVKSSQIERVEGTLLLTDESYVEDGTYLVEVKDGVPSYVPYGVDAETLSKVNANASDFACKVSTTNPITLVHYSDIHGANLQNSNIAKFRINYRKYIDDVILTGDIVPSKFTEYDGLFAQEEYKKILLAIGNHDVYDHNGDATSHGASYDDRAYWATNQEKYNQYFKPSVGNWGVVQPTNAEADGLCYYYKDYEKTYHDIANKVRLIVLDGMAYNSAQHNWLNNVLNDARVNGFTVVIAEHFPPTEAMSYIDCDLFDTGFSSLISGMEMWYGISYLGYKENDINYTAANLVDAFINAGGEFACWLCGHLHYGQVGTLKSHPNQIYIAVEKANPSKVGADTPRLDGSASEDLFNVVSFDTNNKIIRFLRIGAKVDTYGRHKETMCIDYANRRLISTF